jgi:hypothetical protein
MFQQASSAKEFALLVFPPQPATQPGRRDLGFAGPAFPEKIPEIVI